MPTLDDIYRMEKTWCRAYDTYKAAENSKSLDDKARYWLEVHIAWRVQGAIRKKIEAMVDAYVEENIDELSKPQG